MKKKERETLSQQSDADLAEKQKQLIEASWKLRLQKATGQLENPTRRWPVTTSSSPHRR